MWKTPLRNNIVAYYEHSEKIINAMYIHGPLLSQKFNIKVTLQLQPFWSVYLSPLVVFSTS
jgi:hypothetical protein